MSLKVRLVLWVALMLLVSLMLGAGLAWWHATRSVATEMQAALVVGQQTVQTVIPHIGPDDDRGAALRQLIGTFNGNRHLRATLIGTDGATAAVSALLPPPEHVPSWFGSTVMPNSAPSIRIALPEAAGGGSILLETDPHNELTEVWTDFLDDIEILALFAGITFPTIYWTLARALVPLERLASGFREIGAASLPEHVVEEGPPELRQLAAGFNAMVDRLAAIEAKNRRLAEQLSTIQEDERAELARDLHDEIGPYLFSMGVDVAALLASAGARNDEAMAAQIRAIRDGVTHIQHEVRAILARLRTGSLTEFGLPQAIHNLTTFWQSRRPEVTITVRAVAADGFGEVLDGAVYRIVQESLSNAMRHGKPRLIEVVIDAAAGHEVLVEVKDDGGGLKASTGPRGFGIRGMVERTTALGGNLEIHGSAQPAGVRVAARLPLPEGGHGIAA
jgi:two-component system, NarL family, sensor histidine kinase UhpB